MLETNIERIESENETETKAVLYVCREKGPNV